MTHVRQKSYPKLSKQQHLIYDLLISAMALIAVALAIIDLSDGLSEWQSRLDLVILIVFALDYGIRFLVAPDKRKYICTNLCDLIAIFPFHTLFRIFKAAHILRTLKLSGIVRLFQIPRMFAFLYRPLKKARRFFNTNGFKYILFLTFLMIGIGGILIHFAEGMSYSDGIWWAFVTATTVGYGDISPSTLYGRMIAMLLMLLGIGLIGSVTSTLTSYFLNTRSHTVREDTIETIKLRLDDFDNLSEEDIDDICSILKTLKHRKK